MAIGRPPSPSTGLNRQLLLALRRGGPQRPGTLARLLRRDGAQVRDQLARLAAYGHAELQPDGICYAITPAGRRLLRQRTDRSQGVHKAVANSAASAH